MDVVPAVLGFMAQIKNLQPHQGQLFLIVSELFNNALDHGVLGLNSGTKNEEGGFERYLDEREQRLAALNDGRIDMGFHLHMRGDLPVLDIQVKDSGQGFDYSAYLGDTATADNLYQIHGRGIFLVRSLCAEISYGENGNAVFARYAL